MDEELVDEENLQNSEENLQNSDVNMMEMIKLESAEKNIKIYIIAVISLGKKYFIVFFRFFQMIHVSVAMLAYAIYLVYKSEKIKKVLDAGASKIK